MADEADMPLKGMVNDIKMGDDQNDEEMADGITVSDEPNEEAMLLNPPSLPALSPTFTFAKLIEFMKHSNTGINSVEAGFLMLSVSFGSAVVIMAYNFLLLGPLTCMVFTSIIIFTLSYCTTLTYYSCQTAFESHKLKNESLQGVYLILAELAFGKRFGTIVSVIVSIYGVTAGMAFFLLAADICSHLFPIQQLGSYSEIRAWTVICFCLILPVMCMGNYDDLKTTAIMSVVMSIISFLAIIIDSFLVKAENGVFPHPSFLEEHNVPVEHFFISFGMITFAAAGPAYILPNMFIFIKEKAQLPMVITMTHSAITLLYFIGGIIPFIIFSIKVQPSITSTLEKFYLDKTKHAVYKAILIISEISMVVHVLIAGVLMLNPLFLVIENKLNISSAFNWKRLCIRLVGNILLLGLCLAFPNFETVLSLVGGVPCTAVVLIFPILIYIKLHTVSKKKLLGLSVILIVGTVFVIGNFVVEVQKLLKVAQEKYVGVKT